MIVFLFRGIFRDKSRFLFPFSVVGIGVALVVALVGFMEGVFMGMIDMTAKLNAGHLRLVNKPFYDEEYLYPLDRALAAQKETKRWLKKIQLLILSGHLEFAGGLLLMSRMQMGIPGHKHR